MNTVVVITHTKQGSSYHRQVTPHAHLSSHYPADFKVLFYGSYEEIPETDLKDINLVQFSRLAGKTLPDEELIKEMQERGITVVLDIDDYWEVPKDLPAYGTYKYLKLTERIIKCMDLVDHITTTTPYLATEICSVTSKFSDDVTVIPNSINQDIDQFKPRLKVFKPDFIKLGWIGGDSHAKDVASMSGSLKRIHASKEMYKKIQLCLAGFSMNRNNMTVLVPDKDGNLKEHHIKPYETIWGIMERCFTDEFRYLRGKEFEPYLKYLGQYLDTDPEIALDKPYRRLWAKDVTKYAGIYDELDVVAIPVRETKFNCFKSELKMIEAGFFGKAVIVSDIYPYNLVASSDNCLTVRPGQEHIGFFTQFKKLFEDPTEIQRLGRNLRKLVIEKYNMNKVNEVRYELYKELIRKRNAN